MNKRISAILLGIIMQLGALAAPSPFVISGTIQGPKAGDLLILSRINAIELSAKDTVTLEADGKFRFEGEEDGSSIYYLTVNTTNSTGIPVIIEGGAEVQLNIQFLSNPDYTVDGGLHNKDMKELFTLFTTYERQVLELNAQFEALEKSGASEEDKQAFGEQYADKVKERRDAIADFIDSHESSPVTYFACRFLFARPDTKLVITTAEKMGKEYPESEYTKALVSFRKQLGNTIEGAIAPDIRLPSPDGDTISLHSLRGKVVLIDFWASWCGPCRRENPHVVEIYNKYKDKGFEIYGVSLDDTKRKWSTAILQDKLTWVHVSDLKGWSSSAARLYGVRSIPQTYLLDQDGRIHRVGLRAADLEPVIQDLLSRK